MKTAIRLPSGSTRHPKSHEKYWLENGRLFTQHGLRDYCCRFSFRGRRGFFDLDTPNQRAAAMKAARIYRHVSAHGWAAAEKEFKPQREKPAPKALTVGTYLEKVREVLSLAPLTMKVYEQALRCVAGGAMLGITHKGSEHAEWRAAVEGVPLDKIKAHDIAKWMKKRLEEAEGNPLREESIKTSINSIVRGAKALFSTRNVLPKLSDETKALLPSPLPFSDVKLYSEDSSAKFTPTIDPESLLVMARDELGTPRAEGESEEAYALREQQWIAFLLCFTVALRRKEADLLTWWDVVLDHADGPRVGISTTKYLRPKNKAHAKPVPMEPEVAAILRGYRARHMNEEFVLLSARAPDLKSAKPRCYDTWQALKLWLRGKGIDKKPVHFLRKSVGSIMARRHGIHAAQRLLRHTTPVITSKYYSDSEARQTPGIGGLLAGNVEKVDFTPPQKQTATSKRRAAR